MNYTFKLKEPNAEKETLIYFRSFSAMKTGISSTLLAKNKTIRMGF